MATALSNENITDASDFDPRSGRLGIRPFLANPAPAEFLAGSGFCKTAAQEDHLQLKVMKLVLTCHHLSDVLSVAVD